MAASPWLMVYFLPAGKPVRVPFPVRALLPVPVLRPVVRQPASVPRGKILKGTRFYGSLYVSYSQIETFQQGVCIIHITRRGAAAGAEAGVLCSPFFSAFPSLSFLNGSTVWIQGVLPACGAAVAEIQPERASVQRRAVILYVS